MGGMVGLEVEVEKIRSWKWKVEVKGLEMRVIERRVKL